MKSLIVFLLLTQSSFGQTGLGTIQGTLVDENNDPAFFVKVFVYASDDPDQKMVAGCESDFDGRFQLNAMNAGVYDLHFTSIDFDTLVIEGVIVDPERIIRIDTLQMNTPVHNFIYDDGMYCPPRQIRPFDDQFGRSKTIKTEDVIRP